MVIGTKIITLYLKQYRNENAFSYAIGIQTYVVDIFNYYTYSNAPQYAFWSCDIKMYCKSMLVIDSIIPSNMEKIWRFSFKYAMQKHAGHAT